MSAIANIVVTNMLNGTDVPADALRVESFGPGGKVLVAQLPPSDSANNTEHAFAQFPPGYHENYRSCALEIGGELQISVGSRFLNNRDNADAKFMLTALSRSNPHFSPYAGRSEAGVMPAVSDSLIPVTQGEFPEGRAARGKSVVLGEVTGDYAKQAQQAVQPGLLNAELRIFQSEQLLVVIATELPKDSGKGERYWVLPLRFNEPFDAQTLLSSPAFMKFLTGELQAAASQR